MDRLPSIMRYPRSGAGERAIDILDQILGILDAGGYAQCAVEYTGLRAALIREVLVRRGGGMGDQALGVAEIVGNLYDFQGIGKIEGSLLAARKLHADKR